MGHAYSGSAWYFPAIFLSGYFLFFLFFSELVVSAKPPYFVSTAQTQRPEPNWTPLIQIKKKVNILKVTYHFLKKKGKPKLIF